MSSRNTSGGKVISWGSDRAILVAAVVWTVFAWLGAALLDRSGALDGLDLAIIDTVAGVSDKTVAADDIVVVAIDTPSFQDVDSAWPWPRAFHADLLDAAKAAGARAVVFDIVFDANTPDDPAFASAISRFGNVILAAERSLVRSDYGIIETEALPAPTLRDTAAGIGFASVPLDPDGRVRRMPEAPDGLALEAARRLGRSNASHDGDLYIPFRGRGFPRTVSYYQALSPDTRLPDGLLKDKVLIVGLALDANPTGTAIGDTVLLPGHVSGAEPQPGVVAQAHILSAWLNGDALSKAPPLFGALFGAIAIVGSFGQLLLMKRSVLWGLAGATAGVTILLFLLWLARSLGWVAAPGGLAAGLTLAGVGQLSIIGGAALAARRRLAAGFARYVAPDILRRILNSPEPPELGGEHREVSVVVTDLEGFTSLMERLPAAQGAELLRDYLDHLSSVILSHGGLIDQFIGDSVVALFNAPLDQTDHAKRAVDCVQALDKAAQAFRQSLAGAGTNLGVTRIGAATGSAVVGNFGARQRFHYTAMGDVVNTASRLEAANKALGTRVLITEELFAAAGGSAGFGQPLEVELRGKTGPVTARAMEH